MVNYYISLISYKRKCTLSHILFKINKMIDTNLNFLIMIKTYVFFLIIYSSFNITLNTYIFFKKDTY